MQVYLCPTGLRSYFKAPRINVTLYRAWDGKATKGNRAIGDLRKGVRYSCALWGLGVALENTEI
jgi:hypothetical protein